MSKAGETSSIKIDSQGVIGGAQSIDSHVEFSASEKHGVHQISLADVWFWRIVLVEGLPPRNLADAIEDKDSSSLAFGGLCRIK